jgi:DNA-binding protein WhiA
MLSFSSTAKNEICQISLKSCCTVVELCALTWMCGRAIPNASDMQLKYTTENITVAKRIFSTITQILNLNANVEVRDNYMKKCHTYTVVVNNAVLLLDVLGLCGNFSPDTRFPAYLIKKECCKIALLRGAFLGGGTVSHPRKNYHFEFVIASRLFALLLQETLECFKIESKIVQRRQNFVVYLNEGDNIVTLLALIGAHSSILNFENVRILKEMRNNVNRAVNCETANISKTVNAAMTQLHSIHTIDRCMGIEKLSEPLQAAAYLRLQYPEATLQELCELGKTTKSGMNHRLRKINAIADALVKEE